MKTESDPSVTYVPFPISLLRNLLIDKVNVLNLILNYGVYHFADKMNYNLQDVAEQIIYAYYRKNLPHNIQVLVDYYVENEKIVIDDDKCGFEVNGYFSPEEESHDILRLFETDQKFKDLSVSFYKMSQTFKFFYLKGNYDAFKVGNKIAKTIPENEVFAMINLKVLFNYIKYDKTESEIAQLAMYLGIRSILGKKMMYKTNKKMIVARMFGYKNHKELEDKLHPKLKEFYDKYTHRYHFDKIKTDLELNWAIHTYSDHIRGLYVGHGKSLTYEKLAMEAELKKKDNRISELKEKKARAKKNIKSIFKNKNDKENPPTLKTNPGKQNQNNDKWKNNGKPASNNYYKEDPF
ncbi:MAG TPA: hypothetical protein VK172_07345 [Lentimicrobium sp.]|nr:hypothetical protein [Lentimicrobium sp.]